MTLQAKLNKAPVENVRIAKVDATVRRREHKNVAKDLRFLQKSMKTFGLIHPVLVTDDDRLICGERRLQAAKNLGWKVIPARRVDVTEEDDFRQLEIDENECREDFTQSELSRGRTIALKEAMEEIYAEQSESRGGSLERTALPKDPSQLGKLRSRAVRRMNPDASAKQVTSKLKEHSRDSRIVELCDRYPFLEFWGQRATETVGRELDADATGATARRELAGILTALTKHDVKTTKEKAMQIIRYRREGIISGAMYAKLYKRAKSDLSDAQLARLFEAVTSTPPNVDPHLGDISALMEDCQRVIKQRPRGDDCRAELADAHRSMGRAYNILSRTFDALKAKHEKALKKAAGE